MLDCFQYMNSSVGERIEECYYIRTRDNIMMKVDLVCYPPTKREISMWRIYPNTDRVRKRAWEDTEIKAPKPPPQIYRQVGGQPPVILPEIITPEIDDKELLELRKKAVKNQNIKYIKREE